MANYSNKLIADAKLLIALWENYATNVKRSNIIDCIENGADVNMKFSNNCNNTPLHIAVMKGDREVVNILLRYGARPDIANDEGNTAFELAKRLPEHSDIAEILAARKVTATEIAPPNIADKIVTTAVCTYKKRPGTSNVRGQLYETKLLTLIYLRASRCRHVTQFYMGTNVDDIGDMDDVCLRFKTVTDDFIIFVQAKHKDNVVKGRIGIEDLLRSSGDFSLPKYFSSFRKIREKFKLKSDDELFRGRYEDIKCFYIMYTTIKDDVECSHRKSVANDQVTDLIGTGEHEHIFQLKYNEQYIELLTKGILTERIKNMGKYLFKLIQDHKLDNMLCDETISSFHVLLAQKVIKVSDVNTEGRRTGIFREEFFTTNEELLVELRQTLYEEATKSNKLNRNETYISIFRIGFQPTAYLISTLIGNILTYDSHNNILKINDEPNEKFSDLQYTLDSLRISRSEVNEAFEIAGRRELSALTFNVPAAFGNIDMTLSANKKKAEKRLEYLANAMSDVIKESADADGNVVLREGVYATNKRLEAGVLAINGGFASAVGNLLVADKGNKLKFNLDVDSLGENARSLLLRLKDRQIDLQKYRFIPESEDFPRTTFLATEYETRLVTDFLDNLYFYTCQAKEDQVEEIGTREIQIHECSNSISKAESRVRSNALFLKVHKEIQNWWMTEATVPYVMRNTYKSIFHNFNNKGLLSYLNYIYLNEIYNDSLEFEPDAVEVLSVCGRDTCDAKMIVVHTDVTVLTCHKLVQYFRNTEDYIFLDIDYLCQISPSCLKIISNELTETNIPNVVIICEDVSRYNDLIQACGTKKIILITSNNCKPTEDCISVRDDRINLTDLTDASQRKLLETQFSFQGIEVAFAEVFDEETKHLVNSNVLEKIINKEFITLGQTLTMATYEEIKYYYVPRILQLNEEVYNASDNSDESVAYAMPSSSESEDDFEQELFNNDLESTKKFLPLTLIDHHNIFKKKRRKETNDIILLIDVPGMGKSTLLTHLSLETKRRYPKIWIQRINLIDHTKQFHEWHEKKVSVNGEEALKFMCRAVLSKEISRGKFRIFDNNNLGLEIVNEEIIFINREEEDTLLGFELNTFLWCFKEGRIIFLIDGFDEICPHYKKEVTQLLKCLACRSNLHDVQVEECNQQRSVQCVWITSRPYNDLRKTLENEFGESYSLQPFSYKDICIYLDKYMKQNIELNTLTSEQLRNINGFFAYMKQYDLYNYEAAKDVGLVNVPLHSVYVAAMEYFKSEIKRSHVAEENLEYIKDWDVQVDMMAAWRKHLHDYERLHDVLTLSGVPLHVYIAIHYFKSQIMDTTLTDPDELTKQWDLEKNAFTFYERFIDTKLKVIRFEEKNRMDLYNPDVQMTYEKEKKEFLDKHKKLAFYSVCSKNVFLEDELDEIKDIIKRMESGEEKTGLIDRIVNDVPRFVHYTFAEYFAVEYVLDYIKSDDVNKQERMLDYILYNMVFWATNGILNLFELKIKLDSAFAEAMSSPRVRHFVFETLIDQSKVEYPYDVYEDFIGNPEDLTATALDKAARYGMIQFFTYLLDALISMVDETNFTDVMALLEKGTFFEKLIVTNRDELVIKILDCIRRFNASKIDDLFPYSRFECPVYSQRTNEEFIDGYHGKLLEKFYLSLLPSRRNRHMSNS